jgi:two-component system response regulator AtoC
MQSAQILFVSKERSALDLPWMGSEVGGWQLDTATSGWEALERVHAGLSPDVVLLDLVAGDSDGLHTLRWLRRVRPDLPVLVLASCDDAGQKVEAIRLGARDFLIRPLQPRQLEAAIRSSLFYSTESSESEILTDEIEQIGDDMFFVAASPTMRKLRAQAELLAQVSDSVLILGEHGCGKELAARLIHKLSIRSGFRFLKVNCATLPGDLLENEIFGAANRGGANGNGRTRMSKLEACQRGTLFLDEITEMPMSLQAKLLQALRDGYFVRPGSDTRTPMDVRILAATQANIEQAIADRKLREDLYYCLSAFTVHVPALRQRKEEIPLLLSHFMNRLARRYSLPARIFSVAALDSCQSHSWPGNLGELERFVKRYLVIGDGRPSGAAVNQDRDMEFWESYLPPAEERDGLTTEPAEPQSSNSGLKSLVQSVKGETERGAIASALDQARWNRKAAARLLQVSYRTLLYKIEQYHMSPPVAHFSYGGGGSSRIRSLHVKDGNQPILTGRKISKHLAAGQDGSGLN